VQYAANPSDAKKIRLVNRLSPGDVLVMSAAIEMLHQQYPQMYLTDVDSPVPAIWENNPRVTKLVDDDVAIVELDYPLINRCNQELRHFLEGYVEDLGNKLQIPLRLTANRPFLYFSDEEKGWMSQVEEITRRPTRFWVVNAGVKSDFTAKNWGRANYQELLNGLRGQVTFVQIGSAEHHHPPLEGVIDLRGKTDARQLIRLCYHADGGVGPSTFLQHIMAALEKPYVCILGGREPVSWVQYPRQTTFHTIGALNCCRSGGCWRSRIVPLNDGSTNDQSLCEMPILGQDPIPRCMALIRPTEVMEAIMRHCWEH
jgi:ADP-heptose:LPS heptosyltransferase